MASVLPQRTENLLTWCRAHGRRLTGSLPSSAVGTLPSQAVCTRAGVLGVLQRTCHPRRVEEHGARPAMTPSGNAAGEEHKALSPTGVSETPLPRVPAAWPKGYLPTRFQPPRTQGAVGFGSAPLNANLRVALVSTASQLASLSGPTRRTASAGKLGWGHTAWTRGESQASEAQQWGRPGDREHQTIPRRWALAAEMGYSVP